MRHGEHSNLALILCRIAAERNGIRYDYLFKSRLCNPVICRAREHSVCRTSTNTKYAHLLEYICRLGKSTGCVDHVINDYDILSFNISDSSDGSHYISLFA